jgi:hypothetical protein
VLDRCLLRLLHRCGVAAGRAATRRAPGSGDRSGVRRAGRGRPGERRPRAANTGCARAVHVDQADAASVGQAPLCNWAERGFGPVTLELVF